jgi:hypothetical protein
MKQEQKDSNKNQHSKLTDKSKSNASDIGNSLEPGVKGDKGINNYTPQSRTDNEQEREKNKKK